MSSEGNYHIEIVEQFLFEHGYHRALKALEEESLIKYTDFSLDQGGMLARMVEDYFEKQESPVEEGNEKLKELEEMLEKDDNTFCNTMKECLPKVHTANVLSVRFSPCGKLLASGGTGKLINIMEWETGKTVAQLPGLHVAPILCIDFHPHVSGLILTSSMDNAFYLVHSDISGALTSGSMVDTYTIKQEFKVHKKFVVRVKWSPTGLMFASASYDRTVSVFSAASPEEPYELVKQLQFNASVEAVLFVEKGKTLIVAQRDSNYLFYYDTSTWEKQTINMNANKDNVVSFSVMDLALHPSGECIVAATDKNRCIVFPIRDPKQLRNLYGGFSNQYGNPRVSWSTSGHYIYLTTQSHAVFVWNVATEKLIKRLEGHTGLPRGMDHHPTQEVVATGGFDRTIRIWHCEQTE